MFSMKDDDNDEDSKKTFGKTIIDPIFLKYIPLAAIVANTPELGYLLVALFFREVGWLRSSIISFQGKCCFSAVG